jgi:ATP-dependent RNA helicase RhlE
MHFQNLNLIPSLLSTLEREGYEKATPVQRESIPAVLEGRDLLACAQTGTGKTAAFALPILQKLSASQAPLLPGRVRALVLTPTRELAVQIGESFSTYGRNLRVRTAVVYGGVGYIPQKNKLKQGVDVLVATPGRLLDLISQKALTLSDAAIFILDEADRMLDMGFIKDVRRIAEYLPPVRQTLLFSATMPAEIRSLADSLLTDPFQVHVAPTCTTADNIDQSVYFVERTGKPALLRHLLSDDSVERVLVFTRTKHGADRVCKGLEHHGIRAEVIHGNKTQNARQRSLDKFKKGSVRVLVATDIASRGIDVDGISHVVNYELPEIAETYIHRIGRTARAGASGTSVSFCDGRERPLLRDIEKLIRQRIKVLETPFIVETVPVPSAAPKPVEKKPLEKFAKPHKDAKPFYSKFGSFSNKRKDSSFRNSRSLRRNWR